LQERTFNCFEPISTLSECRSKDCFSLALNLIISVWELLDHHLFEGKQNKNKKNLKLRKKFKKLKPKLKYPL
jgi:hypothetical protein